MTESLISAYVGFGASSLLLKHIECNRSEWEAMGDAERLRKELRLALHFAHISQIEIDGRELAGLDITCSRVMGKRIKTGARPDMQWVKAIETPRQNRLQVASMAAVLALGQVAPGLLVRKGEGIITTIPAPYSEDGDFIGVLPPGTRYTYASSETSVLFSSQK